MPIRNVGTLLENIVLIEAAKLAFEDWGKSAKFASAFAMPPLSPWRPHSNDARFDAEFIARRTASTQPSDDYAGLLATCMRSDPSLGPSGALLVGVLARRLRVDVRWWLNDLDVGAHYEGALSGIRRFHEIVAKLEPSDVASVPVVACGEPYPDSLRSLEATVQAWADEEHASSVHLGFLDPMRYTIDGAAGPQTSSEDHRAWLRTLRTGCKGLCVSVHFTGHRQWTTLRPEVEHLRRDGHVEGYAGSLTAWHSYYATTVSVAHPTPGVAEEFLATLRGRLPTAWRAWCGTKPLALTLV
ncbi:MAG: hypothetical protein IT375_32930 [Polyangiaceae bacterium]|nr:hypothetical protein [Polyangiaceae bacterium]